MQKQKFALAVDLGATNIRVAIVNADGKILAHEQAATPQEGKNGHIVTDRIIDLAKNIFKKNKTHVKIAGIGIASCGPLDYKKGGANPANLPFNFIPLIEPLKRAFHVPTILHNDANAAVMGEWRFGAGRGKKNIVYITLSTGIGAGAIVDGWTKARAEALFQDAKALMAKGDYANACPKLARSHSLDPAVGTLLNLALCYEHAGKSASAWASYKQAAAAAHNAGQTDRERFAREHALVLEPNLGTINVTVQGSTLGIEVRMDGALVDPAEWGIAVPVDAGSHRIEAQAPGRKKWASVVDARDGAKLDVVVPLLEGAEGPRGQGAKPEPKPLIAPATGPSPLPPPPSEPAPKKGPWVALSITGFAFGAVGVGLGSVFGVMALDSKSALDPTCGPAHDGCPVSQQGTIDELRARATVSTIAFIAGGVLLAVGGTALAVTLMGGNKSNVRVTAGAATIEGTF